jgi:hypothetical protein
VLPVALTGGSIGPSSHLAELRLWHERRAVTTRRWARIYALGFGVSLMIVVGTNQAGASRPDVVTAGPLERFSSRGACHCANAPSSVAGAPSGGHDGRLAGG